MEINPLVVTKESALIGLDARVEIEDEAVYRQKERLEPLGELTMTAAGRPPTPLELEAQRIDATDHRGVAGRVVEFDGDLALLIGGGGASLTVFDAIKAHGGSPANYCEVGGNPTEEKVGAITSLLLSKPGVKGMAVIMNVVNNTRADVIARGVLMGVEAAGRTRGDNQSLSCPRQLGGGSAGGNGGSRRGGTWTRGVVRCGCPIGCGKESFLCCLTRKQASLFRGSPAERRAVWLRTRSLTGVTSSPV